MIVVDASVAVKWLVPEPGEYAARQLLIDGGQLFAPSLIRIEVTAAILRLYREDRLAEEQARRVCGEWSGIMSSGGIGLIPDEELYAVALEIGFESRHAFQDCLYLAAGKTMKAEVVTADRSLHERGSKAGGRVRLLDMTPHG